MNCQIITKRFNTAPWCVLVNLAGVYLCYEICRFTFLFENWGFFRENLTWHSFGEILHGGWVFDTSAIFYINALYLLLVLFPFHYKEIKPVRIGIKWIFILSNAICIVANLADAVYFPYSKHRTTAIVFDEFKHENNLGTIFGIEFVRHWYLVLLAVLLIFFLIKLYRDALWPERAKPLWKYYGIQILSLAVCVPLAICGIRGGATTAIRPIAVSNAHQYVDHPMETAIVLNTPFAVIRTFRKDAPEIPVYFTDRAELNSLFSPVHYPADSVVIRRKNVVILIVESFGTEFIGALNRDLDNGTYRGYTPFLDSLSEHCLMFRETFSNSGFSIDAMPAVLASIPRMDRSFVLTPASLNAINSIASELKRSGYYTAFFHGADNESMGFQAFARAAGFDDYFGRTEYKQDPRFHGDDDFDGTWAIWDEPFLQYFCLQMNRMKEPFLTSVFTATSHHPFAIPRQYKEIFKDEGQHLIHKCIRYSDHALRQFFATASQQPWYENTLFIITADHASSKTTHAEYKTELGLFRGPIFFFDPSGEMPRGCREGIAQQIDIMPTLLNYLGYDRPYIAFGKDLFHTSPQDTWAMNWDHIPQFIKGDYLLQFDGQQVTGFYNYRTDRLLKHNLKGTLPEEAAMEKQLKAFIQSYIEHCKTDRLVIREEL